MKEKETLVHDYENEEEFLTNDLSRKLTQLRNEKKELERTLEMEQQKQVSKLLLFGVVNSHIDFYCQELLKIIKRRYVSLGIIYPHYA